MNKIDFDDLLEACEQRLDEARAEVAAGQFVDLSDLPQRIAMLCSRAVSEKRTEVATRLAGLIASLDQLEGALRAQITALGGQAGPGPQEAAKRYRAAGAAESEE